MIIAIALGLAAFLPISADDPDSLLARAERRLRAEESRLIAFRRDLHQNPELSGAEERTAGKVAGRLRELGLEVRTGVGGHGVVALIRGVRPGPLVAYRADMDAVPSNAPDPVEFRSLKPGVRHICGHDIHTTIGVALAEALAGLRSEMSGTVMLVFQPAEENVTGAKAMLAAGLFKARKPVAIYGIHTAPLPVGQLGTRPGAMMASIDAVRVTITGSGDLTALGDSAVRIIRSVSTTTRAAAIQGTAPEDGLVAEAQIRQADGGGRMVQGSISSANADARARARQTIIAGLERLRSPATQVKVDYEDRMASGVVNDAGLMEWSNAVIDAAMGKGTTVIVPVAPLVFSEDFGSFQEQVPGVFWFLGVSNAERGWVGMPHTPGYVADEAAIVVAARAMTAVLLDRLRSTP